MGNMKNLYTAMQELEQALREYDPLSFEEAERLIAEAMEAQ